MRTILILNPTSGASNLASNGTQQHTSEEVEAIIVDALRTHGLEPEVWHTTPDDPGEGLARQAAQEGADIVIAAGGDGTIHAVASGVLNTSSVLGIIATGTMNNLARSLGIPNTIAEACEVIARGTTHPIDVGQINDHIFLEVAGVGLEAELFPAAEEIKSQGFASTLRGIRDGLKALFAFQPIKFLISFDGRRSRTYRALQITICNSPYYGARLRFAPMAIMDDGLLDILIYKNFSKLEYIRHAISISQGQRPLEPKMTRRKIRSLYVSAEQPVEVHADGIPCGHTPATISILAGALQVRIPEQIAKNSAMDSPALKQKNYQKPLHNKTYRQQKGSLSVR
ncbi:diacylglycerol kinase family lipid kinase [Ktedonosporobacter rubrisoli]|uniref:Diacylglycerol kinase family lipid kinase n=1 Tax=Ktedonosporobacter rubrisoli TaxID=2509675 RepID=A0A4P6K062_KTERU|nr:diacylglycerol kinase family protein [Ktedonosporobacter rubrisoli]QBD81568.1 diacylglycerol kinase family lipid kinase [Ktedonosporobacter rubrisoli]